MYFGGIVFARGDHEENSPLQSMRIECYASDNNMAAWRRSVIINEISSAEEQAGDESWNEDEPFDENIPLAGYGYEREQGEEEASDAESEISKSSNSESNRAKKKKVGRKSSWKEADITDMVDIVCNSDYYKKRIIFTNSKNSRNNEVYSKLLKDMQERFQLRGHEVRFTVEQVRNKLKKLISECKKVALTVKTATGVNRFQEEKNYGPWFPMLFALVKTRDSCQPERAVEPTAGSEDVNEESRASPAPSVEDSEESTGNGSSDGRKLFVPVKNRGKKRKGVALSAVECMEKLLERDPTKDLLEFYREENEKARRHELQLMQIIMSSQQPAESVQSSTQGSYQPYGYMSVPLQHAYGYMESGGMHQVQGGSASSVANNNSQTFFNL